MNKDRVMTKKYKALRNSFSENEIEEMSLSSCVK
jgi:hypothetical protein